jgi:hypothetical protein
MATASSINEPVLVLPEAAPICGAGDQRLEKSTAASANEESKGGLFVLRKWFELSISDGEIPASARVKNRSCTMLAMSLQRIILPTLVLLAATSPGSARSTQSSFDGRWSVVIITDAGTCDRSYRYGLVVSRGRIYYEGDSSVIVSGGVDPRGRVSVSLRYGQSAARSSGRLSRSEGEGRWQGASSGSRCWGRWVAERRD